MSASTYFAKRKSKQGPLKKAPMQKRECPPGQCTRIANPVKAMQLLPEASQYYAVMLSVCRPGRCNLWCPTVGGVMRTPQADDVPHK
eukprot:539236-Pelagomonas_calceolata.AAC.2